MQYCVGDVRKSHVLINNKYKNCETTSIREIIMTPIRWDECYPVDVALQQLQWKYGAGALNDHRVEDLPCSPKKGKIS